mgnify:FL=1
MEISSRTPEGDDNRCPICDKPVVIAPSRPPGDAPCPHCGYLLWFWNSDLDGSEEALTEREVASMLKNRRIPMEVLETIPESVARENTIIPIARGAKELCIAVPQGAFAEETKQKLEFILDCGVRVVRAKARVIHEAIERNYAAPNWHRSCGQE